MASRVMHLAMAVKLAEKCGIADRERFLLGQVLPDAVIKGDKKTSGSHFDRMISEDRKVMDFEEFYSRFGEKILSDGLYLGYYLHLIEDCVFRKYIYYGIGLLKYRNTDGFLGQLYRDYHSVNGYIVKNHGIDFVPEGDTSGEEINVIYPFDTALFLEDMKNDLKDEYLGNEKYFNAEDAEKVIAECVRVCAEEYEAIKRNEHYASVYEYSWEAKK